MISIEAIDHIVLRTDKYNDLIRFYCDILGCEIVRELADFSLTQLKAGNALIDIIDVAGKLGAPGGPAPSDQAHNMDHFCLQIAPFDEQALMDFLTINNVPHSDFENRFGAQGFGRSIYIQDIIGNTIELKPSKTFGYS